MQKSHIESAVGSPFRHPKQSEADGTLHADKLGKVTPKLGKIRVLENKLVIQTVAEIVLYFGSIFASPGGDDRRRA
jgi:hypothetical protein